MRWDKATGAKKCLKRNISQHFLIQAVSSEAGTFRNPLELC